MLCRREASAAGWNSGPRDGADRDGSPRRTVSRGRHTGSRHRLRGARARAGLAALSFRCSSRPHPSRERRPLRCQNDAGTRRLAVQPVERLVQIGEERVVLRVDLVAVHRHDRDVADDPNVPAHDRVASYPRYCAQPREIADIGVIVAIHVAIHDAFARSEIVGGEVIAGQATPFPLPTDSDTARVTAASSPSRSPRSPPRAPPIEEEPRQPAQGARVSSAPCRSGSDRRRQRLSERAATSRSQGAVIPPTFDRRRCHSTVVLHSVPPSLRPSVPPSLRPLRPLRRSLRGSGGAPEVSRSRVKREITGTVSAAGCQRAGLTRLWLLVTNLEQRGAATHPQPGRSPEAITRCRPR
jgi:hypothetical protein